MRVDVKGSRERTPLWLYSAWDPVKHHELWMRSHQPPLHCNHSQTWTCLVLCVEHFYKNIDYTCAGWTTPELEQVAPSRSAAACAVLDSAENIIIQFLSPLSNSRFYSLTRRKWRKEKTRFQGKEVLTTINAASSYSSPCCYLYLSLAHFKVIIRIIVYI